MAPSPLLFSVHLFSWSCSSVNALIVLFLALPSLLSCFVIHLLNLAFPSLHAHRLLLFLPFFSIYLLVIISAPSSPPIALTFPHMPSRPPIASARLHRGSMPVVTCYANFSGSCLREFSLRLLGHLHSSYRIILFGKRNPERRVHTYQVLNLKWLVRRCSWGLSHVCYLPR